ncbi:MAG: DUF134 domain-containing protein [Pseudomonadota bacterium]
MTRPKCCRHVAAMPEKTCFQPKGMTSSSLDEVLLTLDEYEALRLADLEGLYQKQAAVRMKISRQTFGRIIESAHRKVADVLVNGKALKIEGGDVSVEETKRIRCHRCRQTFNFCCETKDAAVCPHCRKKP